MDLWLHFVIQNGDREKQLQKQLSVLLSLSVCRNVRFWISSWRCAVSRTIFVFTHFWLTTQFHCLHKWHTACHPHLFNNVTSTPAMKWWCSNPPSQLSVHNTLQTSRKHAKSWVRHERNDTTIHIYISQNTVACIHMYNMSS